MDGRAKRFDFGAVVFIPKHLFLGAAGTPSFLPADLGDPFSFGAYDSQLPFFYFIEQDPAGQKAVEGLGALPLAANFDSGWTVFELDAGGDLVHILPAGSAGADEIFLQIRLPNPEPLHSAEERLLLCRGNGEERHRFSEEVLPAKGSGQSPL